MKRIVMCLLLGIWATASAQAPPGEEQAEGPEAAGQIAPCVPADDLPQDSAADTGPLDREQGDATQASVPCEEQLPAEEAGETVAGPETIEEEAGEAIADPETIEQEAGETVAGPETIEQEVGETVADSDTIEEEAVETVADSDTIEEEDFGVEASVEEEFEPGDEISEDYPVPLPSDI